MDGVRYTLRNRTFCLTRHLRENPARAFLRNSFDLCLILLCVQTRDSPGELLGPTQKLGDCPPKSKGSGTYQTGLFGLEFRKSSMWPRSSVPEHVAPKTSDA